MDKKEMYSVNAKILNAERRYGKDSQIVRRIYNTINTAYGSSDMTRFTMLPHDMTFKQKTKIDRALSVVSGSKYLSAGGRAEIRENAIQGYLDSGTTISRVQAEKLNDFFDNSVDWDKIRDYLGQDYSKLITETIGQSTKRTKKTSSLVKKAWDDTVEWSKDKDLNKEQIVSYFNDLLSTLMQGEKK